MTTKRQHSSPHKTLWIGGSSGLARTYVGVYGCDGLVLVGLEQHPPAWIDIYISTADDDACHYYSCDLTNPLSVQSLVDDLFRSFALSLDSMIVSVRAPLVTGNGRHEDLLDGIEVLARHALNKLGIRHVVHVSSVAAVNHLRAQVEWNEDVTMPPMTTYSASYDLFKRKSEDILDRVMSSNTQRDSFVQCTHLRVSALFSDSPHCIQCGALALQTRLSAYLSTKIDCNSSRNVAVALHLLLTRMRTRTNAEDTPTTGAKSSSRTLLLPVYYYTRPSSLPQPIAYGEYLMEFRRACDVHYSLWIPMWLVEGFVRLVQYLTLHTFLQYIRTVVCVNYLLQVSAREHSFDNTKFLAAFPEISKYEETIYECFVRRRHVLAMHAQRVQQNKKKTQ